MKLYTLCEDHSDKNILDFLRQAYIIDTLVSLGMNVMYGVLTICWWLDFSGYISIIHTTPGNIHEQAVKDTGGDHQDDNKNEPERRLVKLLEIQE